MKTTELLLCTLATCGIAGCSDPIPQRNTPIGQYASELPYKIVFIQDQVFLKFMANDTAPFGPFFPDSHGTPAAYTYEDSRGGVRSIRSHGEDWWYSWSHIKMRAQEVDASELERR